MTSGAIRSTLVDPGTTVAWEGDRARGTVDPDAPERTAAAPVAEEVASPVAAPARAPASLPAAAAAP